MMKIMCVMTMAISVIMIIISEFITVSVDDNDCLCDDDNPLYISDLCYDDDLLCDDNDSLCDMMVTISVRMMHIS
jgi:hypothetical protein